MSLCHAILGPGESTSPHHLGRQTEVYYILTGEGDMYIGKETAVICSGQAIVVPPGTVQWVRNTRTDEFIFLAICQPQWQEAYEAILE